jgi:hypothetical protein
MGIAAALESSVCRLCVGRLPIDGLYCWLQDTPSPAASRSHSTPPASKTNSAWAAINCLLGWSKLSAIHQSLYIQRRNIYPTSTHQRTSWSSRPIALMRNRCFTAWIDRNQAPWSYTSNQESYPSQFRLEDLDLRGQCFWFCPSLDEHLFLETNPTDLKRGLR